jgi:hypothetical protein
MMNSEKDQLPTEGDFCDPQTENLDERHARATFLGKTSAQAEQMFRENFLYYQEALLYMRGTAFRYYVIPAIRYLLSDGADGDSSAASSFCTVLTFKLQYAPADMAPVRTVLLAAVREILHGFHRYDCTEYIYGDVAARYRALAAQLESLPQ